jgi:predicted nucleotidyltransferase
MVLRGVRPWPNVAGLRQLFTALTRSSVDARLWPTLADAVAMLDSRGLPAALIGGLAVSLRGQPRMTVDVDLVVRADVDAALQLVRSLAETPFEPLFAGVEEVVTTAFILPLRHRSTGIRVDLAIGMSGFEREAIRRATRLVVGAGSVPVVTVEDLLIMKALAGRPQDEGDIRGLVELNRDSLDWNRCLATATALGAAIDIDIASRLRAARDGSRQEK